MRSLIGKTKVILCLIALLGVAPAEAQFQNCVNPAAFPAGCLVQTLRSVFSGAEVPVVASLGAVSTEGEPFTVTFSVAAPNALPQWNPLPAYTPECFTSQNHPQCERINLMPARACLRSERSCDYTVTGGTLGRSYAAVLTYNYGSGCGNPAQCIADHGDPYVIYSSDDYAWASLPFTLEGECQPANLAAQSGKNLANICKPLGITWEMPSIQSNTGNSWPTKDGVIPASEVQKKQFLVILRATNGGDKIENCPSDRHYKWKVKFKGTPAKTYKVGTSCNAPLFVNEEGQYSVSVEEFKNSTGKSTQRKVNNATVTVQDWLIVAIGDSNGSGQGTAKEGVPYTFPQCDRGPGSYQSLAAEAIDAIDDKTSVTFIHAACSGARTVHLTDKRYLGQEINTANPLNPQIKQVSQRLGKGKKQREVDAVILSIGINDLLFGGILATCLGNVNPYSNCQNLEVEPFNDPHSGNEPTYQLAAGGETLDVRSKRLAKTLQKKYAPVAESLAALDILPKRIFITGYPEPTTGDDGLTCGGNAIAGFTTEDWAWLATLGQLLNRQISATRKSYGWTPITDIGNLFSSRGVCSSNPLFQTIVGSVYTQANIFGTFHSKIEGHGLMAGLVMKKICKQMYGNDKCAGNPRKPR